MSYTPTALRMLDELGIPLSSVMDRNLQEFVEANGLELAEVDANGREHWLTSVAAQAWRQLKVSASEQGVEIYIVSAFRSVERQAAIIKRKLDSGLSIENILRVSAPPFFSEHHTGCAVDIGTPGCAALEREFEDTLAFEWLAENAESFGFQMSYPLNNPTGYAYEPWHWRVRSDFE
ncbi:D-alanyl-D-alanine carboxypeptidase family protein [Pseudomonas sp. CCI3.2]|uniref:M15 family metallopeptidase n=1 Tax=unclassified Pseudomonas TaxID=196821 RepID=UPI002AC93E3C|nr:MULTISPECIES: M15 family metallopeptidase [unclassified Pseudomonas]MEB0077968.1 D-alanyl-D-alanine carboxypeptidase family protein [Pseudomonas sp. MH10out]MEB0093474.1 D-alanyl-D-alanine carboxypeptidase family protein [Pseudomonas sp. CCI4.2]MEB0101682.1 D-alanyl-D-alanine carboxypeptidase family protein [Pseudomonas sp. CCI3.2]MEB0129444.1 D-alanyl-D-alanine carboxypeptidase family protein [Pseudomonas sp. CCI2.4]MEB0159187.1 D-alanyl-D-alanine carboxypeptidase family protein [Pseudomon